ncbi:MAG TPA: TolC family protein [Bryobacteraceae bacterium]|nr:TolC family protein [Bryobacteraceae bacterium]
MRRFQTAISIFCVQLLIAPVFAQQTVPIGQPGGTFSWLTGRYRMRLVPPVNLANSGRLEMLLRAGRLYLSMQDAIALALENNLDIEIQRYGPQIADAQILRARAGGFAQGVSTSVTAGPTSAQPGGVAQSGVTGNPSTQASAASSTAVGNTVITQSGPAIPSFDPALVGSASWAHQTVPESTVFIAGTDQLVQRQDLSGITYQQGFQTGTSVSLGLNNSTTVGNSTTTFFNPVTSSSLGLTVTQHLLQGFSLAVNQRQIQIAKNNRELSDLTFKLQVITTVAAVMDLYWDLVTFNENVRVQQQAVATSQKLYDDNQKQVEAGMMAPIEVVRAEAQLATDQQNLTLAETQRLQQETILKNALSRNGVASPSVAEAQIVPTDRIRVPDVEPVTPIQDLVAMALASRPELAQNRIQVTNQEITLHGSRNGLLPTLDLVASMTNNALAGQVSTVQSTFPFSFGSPSPAFIGGYGTVLKQLFARNYPNYSAGFNLTIPLRNRAAQAQALNDELTLRQLQLGVQRLENQVRVDVQNALIGVRNARAQYQAATKARILQERTLDAEQKKYAAGASVIYNVILTQRDLATARQNELAAEAAYAKSKVELDRVTGQTLNNNGISLREAFDGMVSRPPSALPPADRQGE